MLSLRMQRACREMKQVRCQPKISVIVPVYNTEDYLPRCIESILKQTYQNIEIILVDDGSTDASLHVCEKYAREDSRIVTIQQENKGNNAARKAGLAACTGEYITFVDSDDWIGSNLVALLYQEIEENHADMAVSNVMMIRMEGTQEERRNLIDAGVYENPRTAVRKLFLRATNLAMRIANTESCRLFLPSCTGGIYLCSQWKR